LLEVNQFYEILISKKFLPVEKSRTDQTSFISFFIISLIAAFSHLIFTHNSLSFILSFFSRRDSFFATNTSCSLWLAISFRLDEIKLRFKIKKREHEKFSFGDFIGEIVECIRDHSTGELVYETRRHQWTL
jgi:hypothetical protein